MKSIQKLLIAEDNEHTRQTLIKMVESLGYTCIQASDGQLAWDILQCNTDISLVITDMLMPKIDGYGLIQRCRQHNSFKDLPIIVISGVINSQEIQEMMDLGTSRFLPKPIKKSDLEAFLNELIPLESK